MKSKRKKSHPGIHNNYLVIFAALVVLGGISFNVYKSRRSFSRKFSNHVLNLQRKFWKGIEFFQNLFERKPKVKIHRKVVRKQEDQINDYDKLIMTYKSVVRFETAQKKREGGGFMVRRPVGDKIDTVDPFLMLDHLGPVIYGPGEAIGAPDHPHRGFETVTYVIDGGFHHQDSAGNNGNLKNGWVQWMTAGSGVVHSEMPTDELLKKGGRMEGFQLWVNLPKKFKMVPPRYQDTPPERIPIVKSPDGNTTVKVIAGSCLGVQATIETRTPILFLDIKIDRGNSFDVTIPDLYNSFVYVWRGNGFFGDKPVTMGQVSTLSTEGEAFQLKASNDSALHVLVIAGQPISEPIARYGPFVMNTFDEIEQAFSDYRSGKLGKIDGSEERYAKTESAVNQNKKTGNWNEH